MKYFILLLALIAPLPAAAWEKAQLIMIKDDSVFTAITQTSGLTVSFKVLSKFVTEEAWKNFEEDIMRSPTVQVEFDCSPEGSECVDNSFRMSIKTKNSYLKNVFIVKFVLNRELEGAGIAHGPGTVAGGVTKDLLIHARIGDICVFVRARFMNKSSQEPFMAYEKGHPVDLEIMPDLPYIIMVNGVPMFLAGISFNQLPDGQKCGNFGH